MAWILYSVPADTCGTVTLNGQIPCSPSCVKLKGASAGVAVHPCGIFSRTLPTALPFVLFIRLTLALNVVLAAVIETTPTRGESATLRAGAIVNKRRCSPH